MSSCELRPLFARVLLERRQADKMGSILVPKEASRRFATLKCRVLAVGPTVDPSIRVGQEVIIGQHTGTWITPDGSQIVGPEGSFFIVQDEDILAIVGDETNGND